MKIKKLVELSQIIGVVLVIVSLVFIGIEINQNTVATKASIRQSVAANDMTYLISSLDPVVIAEANAKIIDGIALSTKEKEQLIWQQYINFMSFETYYYNYQVGYLDNSLWERYRFIITFMLKENLYSQAAYKRYSKTFTEEFRSELTGIMKSNGIKIK